MTLHVAIQMDPIETLRVETDSTLRLALEAAYRGHRLYYYTPQNLVWREGKLRAWAHALTVHRDCENYYEVTDPEWLELTAMDVILLRQDPPFNMHYLTATYLLEHLPPTTLVVNNPVAVRNSPEKLLICHFPDLIPPTLITERASDMIDFIAEHKEVVVKPLYGHGGKDVLLLREGDVNNTAVLALMQRHYSEPLMVQRYEASIREGDKRIILIDGEPCGVIKRIPAVNEIRSNLVLGGSAEATELTERDHHICERLRPYLKAHGLIFTGIDVIGSFLTEINVTSPTGLVAIERLYSTALEEKIWNCIEQKLADLK